MYNKIFTKILDSSIWLEPDATRIVWITLIAAMDETGFCHFASILNLAHRANVTREAAEQAVKTLESPDPDSSDPENEGRRIERVAGGWIVLNAEKYREIVSRSIGMEANRRRVQRFRENKRLTSSGNACVMLSNDDVMPANEKVTLSEAETTSLTSAMPKEESSRITAGDIYQAYPRRTGKQDALKSIAKALKLIQPHDPAWLLERVQRYAKQRAGEDSKYTPHPATWFNRGSYEDESLEPPLKREVLTWEQYNEETGLHFDPEKNAWFDKNGIAVVE